MQLTEHQDQYNVSGPRVLHMTNAKRVSTCKKFSLHIQSKGLYRLSNTYKFCFLSNRANRYVLYYFRISFTFYLLYIYIVGV